MYYREPCQHPKAPALGVVGRCRDRLVWASMHESSAFSQPTGRRKTASCSFQFSPTPECQKKIHLFHIPVVQHTFDHSADAMHAHMQEK